MRYLPLGTQMKEADQYTIKKLEVPSLELMERAAKGCVAYIKAQNLDCSDVCIVCGSGNNGGDGFAIGRLLLEDKRDVSVVFAGNREHCSEECEQQIAWFEEKGGRICNHLEKKEYSIIIDAVFGVGLNREVSGKYREILKQMNEIRGVKVAVDIPSGISADTGEILGTAFKADYTVTFQNEKFGMKIFPGKEYSGKIHTVNIGISEEIFRDNNDICVEMDSEDYKKMLPIRKEDSNKSTYGKLLVIAGSEGMSGAAYFNAKSAYRVGAGVVRIYTPESNRMILQQLLPEAVLTTYHEYRETELKELLAWADVICIGSGIGKSKISEQILKATLKEKKPCVVDADGLNLLAEIKDYGSLLQKGSYIFTPHIKEMSRLTKKAVDEIKRDRKDILKEFTIKNHLTCVLKDSRTLIGSDDRRQVLNISGNMAMAKAGSGDVLAGIIAGLLAQGITEADSAVLGTYIHGRTGDFARNALGVYSVMAEDLMSYLAGVMYELSEGRYNIDESLQ